MDMLMKLTEIVDSIKTATSDRVKNLNVRIEENAVFLEGTCKTFHVKQIASTSVIKLLQNKYKLHNDLVVTH